MIVASQIVAGLSEITMIAKAEYLLRAPAGNRNQANMPPGPLKTGATLQSNGGRAAKGGAP